MTKPLLASTNDGLALCNRASAAYVAGCAEPNYETDLVAEAATKNVDSTMTPPPRSHDGLA